jgi:hypothetical protein
MDASKFVAMITWVCPCGNEYRQPIDMIAHNNFDPVCCIPCNAKDGDRIELKICNCRRGRKHGEL